MVPPGVLAVFGVIFVKEMLGDGDALLLRHPHGMTSRACGYLTYQLALAIVAVHERALVHK